MLTGAKVVAKKSGFGESVEFEIPESVFTQLNRNDGADALARKVLSARGSVHNANRKLQQALDNWQEYVETGRLPLSDCEIIRQYKRDNGI